MKTLLVVVLLLSAASSTATARRTCKTFANHAQAQAYYESRRPGWKRLDGDHDGEACECLPGGSGEDKSVCVRWRKRVGIH